MKIREYGERCSKLPLIKENKNGWLVIEMESKIEFGESKIYGIKTVNNSLLQSSTPPPSTTYPLLLYNYNNIKPETSLHFLCVCSCFPAQPAKWREEIQGKQLFQLCNSLVLMIFQPMSPPLIGFFFIQFSKIRLYLILFAKCCTILSLPMWEQHDFLALF